MVKTVDLIPLAWQKWVGNRPWLPDAQHRAQQMAFTLVTECLGAPNTPFLNIAENGLLLNEETESFLYDEQYGYLSKPYRRGSRPMLEGYLESIVDDATMTPREKVIALTLSMNDLPQRYGEPPAFLYGESDEETLLKGGGHCSCKSRLLTSLCQILGLQARPAMFWIGYDREHPDRLLGGHTVVEVLLDGNWSMFDPQCHLYCVAPDGHVPSLRELRRNPSLLLEMPEELKREIDPWVPSDKPAAMDAWTYYAGRFFHPSVPISISRHEVSDDTCEIHWNWADDAFRKKQQEDHAFNKRFLIDLANRGELMEEVYRLRLGEFRERFGITNGRLEPLGNVL